MQSDARPGTLVIAEYITAVPMIALRNVGNGVIISLNYSFSAVSNAKARQACDSTNVFLNCITFSRTRNDRQLRIKRTAYCDVVFVF